MENVPHPGLSLCSILQPSNAPSRLHSLPVQLGSMVANMTENKENILDDKNGCGNRNEGKEDERGGKGS